MIDSAEEECVPLSDGCNWSLLHLFACQGTGKRPVEQVHVASPAGGTGPFSDSNIGLENSSAPVQWDERGPCGVVGSGAPGLASVLVCVKLGCWMEWASRRGAMHLRTAGALESDLCSASKDTAQPETRRMNLGTGFAHDERSELFRSSPRLGCLGSFAARSQLISQEPKSFFLSAHSGASLATQHQSSSCVRSPTHVAHVRGDPHTMTYARCHDLGHDLHWLSLVT